MTLIPRILKLSLAVSISSWCYNSLVERDLWLVFEGNVIVRLFSEPFSVSSEAIAFLADPYY